MIASFDRIRGALSAADTLNLCHPKTERGLNARGRRILDYLRQRARRAVDDRALSVENGDKAGKAQ